MNREIISTIPSVKERLDNIRNYKKLLRREMTKLEREHKYYLFLERIITNKGNDLIPPLAEFFRAGGYEKVDIVDNQIKGQNKKEDLHIYHGNEIIISEVTSDETNNQPSSDKAYKVKMYQHNAAEAFKGKVLHGLFIINSMHGERNLHKRKRTPFDSTLKKTALNSNYTLITTMQLALGYLKLKTGEITFEDFHKTVTTPGEAIFEGYTDNKNKGGGDRKKAR
jgi:hypothetical protein